MIVLKFVNNFFKSYPTKPIGWNWYCFFSRVILLIL